MTKLKLCKKFEHQFMLIKIIAYTYEPQQQNSQKLNKNALIKIRMKF